MTKFNFGISDETISVFVDGRMYVLTSGDMNYHALREHLMQNEHDYDLVSDLVDTRRMISRLTEGLVTVIGETVNYKGTPVRNSLAFKLVAMLNEGFDVKPWAKFMENMMENPSEESKESLYDFLDHFVTPITPDGHFLAFKRVRGNFMDIHSGTYDNSPGAIVTMARYAVDDDSNQTCSRGLHACASSYLGNFYSHSPDCKVVVVKINPRDVVAVPADYSFSKMRVCRYEVLAEAAESDIDTISESQYSDWGQEDMDIIDDLFEDDDYWDDNREWAIGFFERS